MTAVSARAQGASAVSDTELAERSERAHVPGQRSFVELNALAGMFTGLRLKGIVHPTQSLGLAFEGLEGARFLTADGSVARTERGGGARAEFCVSSLRRDAAILAPGLDLMYQPRIAPSTSWLGLFDDKGRDRALLLETNVDFMILHEFAEHAAVLLGFRGGAVVSLKGHDDSGKSLAGATRADGALYVGARF